jgi:hypothetical protein
MSDKEATWIDCPTKFDNNENLTYEYINIRKTIPEGEGKDEKVTYW